MKFQFIVAKCPHNQVYSTCASPCGPNKCENDGMVCAAVCVNGCRCPSNTCMVESGKCIPDKRF